MNSCERRFKLDVYNREAAKRLPFSERLFNSLDPILQAQARRYEDQWEASLRAGGLADLTGYAVTHAATSLSALTETLRRVERHEGAYAREVELRGQVGVHHIEGRADFIILRWEGDRPILQIVECKGSRKDRSYHRIQVALYQMLLRQSAERHELRVADTIVSVDSIRATVARIDETTNGIQPILDLGNLDLSIEMSDLGRLLGEGGQLQRIIQTDVDDLSYAIEPKCDGCVFSVHCLPESGLHRRLQLLGLQPSVIRALRRNDIRTIDDLADIDMNGENVVAIRADTGCLEPIERLRAQASARRRTLPGADERPEEYAVQSLPRSGFGQLPEHAADGRRLVRVYLCVDYDYIENRIGALSAHVTNSDHLLYTPFLEQNGRFTPDPVVVERDREGTVVDGRRHYETRAPQGSDIVEIVPTEWSQQFDRDSIIERQFLLSFFQRLTAAIADLAQGGQVAVHFYLWSRSEIRRLVEACARAGGGLLSNMRELLGCREELEQLIFSCLQDEVEQRYALGWTGRGVAVVTSLRWFGQTYHWTRMVAGDVVQLDRVFEQDIFDFKSTLALQDGRWAAEGRGERTLFEIRSRFHDTLTAPYWHAHWRTLRARPEMDQRTRNAIERYNRASTPGMLLAYLRARLHALRWVEERIVQKNRRITKTAMPVIELPNFALGVDDVGRAAIDFLRLDHHVSLQEWFSSHLPVPADRVSGGRMLPIRDVLVGDDGNVHATIDAERYGTTLEALSFSSIFVVDSFVRISPASADPAEGQNVTTFLYDGVTAVIKALDWQRGRISFDILGAQSTRYIFSSSRDGEPGDLLWQHATVDESPSDYVSGHVDARLSMMGRNHITTWFDPLDPRIPAADALDENSERLWSTFVDELRLPPRGDGLNEEQKDALLRGMGTRVQLLQGPPGTGKTTVTAITTLMRAFTFCRPGDVILVGANTKTAVETVLMRLLRDGPSFGECADRAGIARKPLVLARVHSSTITPSDPGIEDLSPSVSPIRRFREIRARGVVVACGTTAALLKYVKKLNESATFRQDPVVARIVIVDEASMMVLPHFLAIASLCAPDGRVFLAGDHNQLPPIVSHNWDEEDRPPTVTYQPFVSAYTAIAQIAAQGVLAPSAVSVDRLQLSYRLPWAVRDLLNRLYARDAVILEGLDGPPPPPLNAEDPLGTIWLNERGLYLLAHSERASRESNRVEGAIIRRVLDAANELPDRSVALITPHRAQRAFLAELFEGRASVRLTSTVESMQGGECPNVIVSGTVSDPSAIASAPQFYLSLNRSNVAFSRTQNRLIVVCSSSLLDHIPPETQDYENALLWKSLRLICTEEVGTFEVDGQIVRVLRPRHNDMNQAIAAD